MSRIDEKYSKGAKFRVKQLRFDDHLERFLQICAQKGLTPSQKPETSTD